MITLTYDNESWTPNLKIYFQHSDENSPIGVCNISLSWPDTDEGWDKAEKAFDKMEELRARELVNEQLELLK